MYFMPWMDKTSLWV